ncbi:MAG: serine hydrolase, partial [Bacteroidales bacterium]|nr:serine hydrolase [Bacteroidales bacterium]
MRKYLFILFSMVMISSCTKAQNSMAEAIDKLCAPLFPNGEPGAAVLVMKGNDIIFDKGYGIADIETKAKIDGNTFFNVA